MTNKLRIHIAKLHGLLLMAAALFTLSACGGGGGGGGNTPNPPPPPPTPSATTPLAITTGNAINVIAVQAAFAENIVDLSATIVNALVRMSEARQAMVTINCDSGSVEITLTDDNGNGLPSANETMTLNLSSCAFNGNNLTTTGLIDIDVRSYVVASGISVKAKLSVSTNGPITVSIGGETLSVDGDFEIDYIGDDSIQTLAVANRFGDQVAVTDAGGVVDTFSNYEITRAISVTDQLTTDFAFSVASNSLVGAIDCSTSETLTGPLAGAVASGTIICTGGAQSAARAVAGAGNAVAIGADPEGDGSFVDAGQAPGGNGTWADYLSDEYFALTTLQLGVVPEQVVSPAPTDAEPFAANAVVMSPDNSRIYMTENSGIRIVDAVTLAEIDQLALTDNPGPIAISDSGNTLWVGFSGAEEIQSIDVATLTPGARVAMGTSPIYANRVPVRLRVAPGTEQTVIVTFSNKNEMLAFDGGTARANFISSTSTPTHFDFTSTSQIIGIDNKNTSAAAITLNAGGLILDDVVSGFEVLTNTRISVGSQIYSTSGRVFNPATSVVEGRVKLDQVQTDTSRDGVLVDESAGVAYWYDQSMGLLESYDATKLILQGAHGVSASGNFVDLLDAGNALIVVTNSQFVRVEKSELSANRNSSLCQALDLSGQIADGYFAQIDCGFNDAIYSPANDKIYATLPSFAGVNGNSLVTIEPSTGEITAAEFIGSEPNALALSADESRLYVAVGAASKVAVVNLPQATVGSYINLDLKESSGKPTIPRDVAVSPTDSNTIVIATNDEASVYTGGVNQGVSLAGFIDARDVLTLPDGSGALVHEADDVLTETTIGAGGIVFVSSNGSLVTAGSLKLQDAKLYDRDGRIVQLSNSALLGTCPAPTAAGTLLVEPSVGSNTVYYVDQSVDNVFKTCDETNFALGSTRQIPSFGDTISAPKVLEEAGGDILVLATSDKLVMFDPAGIR